MAEDESTLRPGPDPRQTVALSGAGASVSAEAAVGDVIAGRYRLDGILGSGGMGVVFEAMHLELGERVAVKLLARAALATGERLRREARIGLRIQGEHVVRAMDVGTLPSGAPYVVMERLSGQDLAAVLREGGPLPLEDAVDYVLQACVAMAEAHAIGVVHRDLKPHNLFLTRRADGSPLVKVLDFGIAKTGTLTSGGGEPLESLTLSTTILGSPQYMAPEQVRGAKDVDHRADVWALGVILYELLAGAPPFSGNGPSAVLAAIAADPPARLRAQRTDVPAAIEEAIDRCLEKDPARRTPDVGTLAAAIAPFSPPRSKVALERIAGIPAQSGWAHPDGPRSPPADGPGDALTVTVGGIAAGSRRVLRYAAAVLAIGGAATVLAAQRRPLSLLPSSPAEATVSSGSGPAPSLDSPAGAARAVPPGPAPAREDPPVAVPPVLQEEPARARAGRPPSNAGGGAVPQLPRRPHAAGSSTSSPVLEEKADVEAATRDRH